MQALLKLMEDDDSDVRDWATFAVGQMEEINSPEVRDALAARLTDEDDATRSEAISGLAVRKDERVVEPLLHVLAGDDIYSIHIEAAENMADARFYPALVALRERYGDEDEELEAAIAACGPEAES